MLKINSLSHRYGAVPTLNNIHLTLAPGEILCLLGPSGCGKSTLLRLAAGLEPLQAGEISLAGRVIAGAKRSLPPERRNIGMVFQDFALFPHLTVEQNIAFGLTERSKADQRSQARLWAERIGMLELIGAYPHMLSGGQQQRVALARALAPSPNLMLMDEPFSSLDSSLRDRLRDATLALLKETGVATLLVTHDPDEAMRMADRIILMRDGAVEQLGRPLDLYERPGSPFAAAFLGAITQFDGQARDGKVQNDLGCFEAPILSGPVTLIVREEAFHRAKEGGGVMALVTEARSLGREHLIGLRIGAIDLRARWTENRLPALGERIPIALDRRRIHLFAKEL